MDEKSDGQTMAEAWVKWIESPEGKLCAEGSTSGDYLKNRLWRAFMAGCKEQLRHAPLKKIIE